MGGTFWVVLTCYAPILVMRFADMAASDVLALDG
jgi:hypothetical protein